MQGKQHCRFKTIAMLCRYGADDAVRGVQQPKPLGLGTPIAHQQAPGFAMGDR